MRSFPATPRPSQRDKLHVSRAVYARQLTLGPNSYYFAKHAVSQSVFSDDLEFVGRTRREPVDRHLSTARRSHRNRRPVCGPCFAIPANKYNIEEERYFNGVP